ncbi:pseudouridine synthase [Aliikangiella sp. IMCC44653]
MRLDQFIAQTSLVSRSRAKQIILKGRVKVDDQQIKNPKHQVKLNSQGQVESNVVFKGERLTLQGKQYVLLNKPQGFLCSTQDEVYPSALNLLTSMNTKGCHFAGRLDQDSTGVVLVSNDGQWTHNITSPRKSCIKQYLVTTAESLSQSMISQLCAGVQLKREKELSVPVEVVQLSENQLRLSISEGKYHQVKRMLAAVGNKVIQLHRESVGGIELGDLKLGEWRPLTASEISLFN